MRNPRLAVLGSALLLIGWLPAVPPATGEPVASVSAGDRWGANYFPNFPLINHEGKTVRFFDDLLKGKVVVLNFIYTTCPDVCPLETAKLKELQGILGDRVGDDVFMYSITIDPETDTPEVLARYARDYDVGPGWWFLTGKEEHITILRKRLGLYIDEIQEEGSLDHNLSLIIGNQKTGRWMKRSPFENPYYLARQVGSWLHNWKYPEPRRDSYSNAPKLRNPSTGEQLFRTRCSSCHIIGGRDQLPPQLSGRLLGPDLLDVTGRRDRSWLARWLAEPDRMLAEKDPLAMELFAKHDRVSMPNMALNPQDVEALLHYLEVESERVRKNPELANPPPEETTACCRKTTPGTTGGEDRSATEPGIDRGNRGLTAILQAGSTGLGCLFLMLAAVCCWRSRSRIQSPQEPSNREVE